MLTTTFYTKERFDSRDKAAAFLESLGNSGPAFVPTAFGPTEPIKTVLTPASWESAVDLLAGGKQSLSGDILLKCGKSKSTLWINWSSARTMQEWSLHVPTSYSRRPTFVKDFLEFVEHIAEIVPLAFAGSCTEEDWDRKHLIVSGSTKTKIGVNLNDCLPGVYWLTIFGEYLKDHFGKRLKDLPVQETLELANGALGLLLTSTPYAAPAVLHEREDAVIDGLGRDYFFDKQKPDKLCKKFSV